MNLKNKLIQAKKLDLWSKCESIFHKMTLLLTSVHTHTHL